MTRTEPIVIPPVVVDALRNVMRQLVGDRDRLLDADADADARPQASGTSIPILLSAVQAGEVLGINETTVRQLWRDGDLKCVHIGRGRKVSTTEIQRYINDHEHFSPVP